MKDPGNEVEQHSVADPDLELRKRVGGGGGGGVLDLLAPLAFFPSVISSFFTQNKGEGRAPRSANGTTIP